MSGDGAMFARGGEAERAIDVADDVVGYLAEELADDRTVVLAMLALLGRVAMVIHAGDVARAQGLINGICESAKLEALALSDGGRA